MAFRAEKYLGAIPWGKSEADVYIMRDSCNLNPAPASTLPKVVPTCFGKNLPIVRFRAELKTWEGFVVEKVEGIGLRLPTRPEVSQGEGGRELYQP